MQRLVNLKRMTLVTLFATNNLDKSSFLAKISIAFGIWFTDVDLKSPFFSI